MKLFDCDIAYGRGMVALPREVESVSELIAELDHCGIAEGLVWHRDALERDFALGNRRLAEVEGRPRLHPTMTFVPACCDEMPSPADFIDQVRTAGARAVRAFPARHCFSLDVLACGDLLDAFCACSIPVIVPLPEMSGGWDAVCRLMSQMPQLSLILTETGCWGQDRLFRPLMKAYPKFFITMNRLETAGQLKSIVDRLGPDHVLFGSGLPRNYPGGYILSLLRADIAEEAREAIAHGNIERLLAEVSW